MCRSCKRCGQPIVGRRSLAIYCSDKCKERRQRPYKPNPTAQAAYRAKYRQAKLAAREAAKRPCKKCGQPIPTSKRANAVYCSDECRQYVSRARPVEMFCEWCGEPFIRKQRSRRRFCSYQCRGEAQYERDRQRLGLPLYPPCGWCGKPIIGRRRGGKRFCSTRCRAASVNQRRRRREGRPPDRQEKRCAVCDVPFVSRRAMQIYCSRRCKQYAINRRWIDKRRKTNAPPRVSQEMISQRAAAIRPAWSVNPDLS